MVGRDESGKFIKGHKGGPGRPKKAREQKFYDILVSTVTVKDWQDIILRAVAEAKRGDQAARTWLTNYYAGPPQQKLDLTSGGQPISWATFIQTGNDNANTSTDSQ